MRRAASGAGVYIPRIRWRPSQSCSAWTRYSSCSIAAAGLSDASSMSVSMGPGMISSTRIPNWPTSACNDSPIALTAALLER